MLKIRSQNLEGAEIAWFAPLCNGDDRYIGSHNSKYKSNWDNTSKIAITADKLGYKNILCPSSYQVGQDTLTFASAIAPLTKDINLLAAIRCGEVHPPMLGRAIATLDHILKGRLTLNIISSNLPGTNLDSSSRYLRSKEVIQILKQGWTQDYISFKGEFYSIELEHTRPLKTYQQNGGPLLYFGGYSPSATQLCAEHCDVYLMWPETKEKLHAQMTRVSEQAANHHRILDYGLRIHVIVRETEAEAITASKLLMQNVDEERGAEIRERALDAKSYGVQRQTEARAAADKDGFIEDNIWAGIGRARSGCGAAIVGDPDQVYNKIIEYQKMGIRAFIFSGYPHIEECELFGKYVLPRLKNISLPVEQQRKPDSQPDTPLAGGKRS